MKVISLYGGPGTGKSTTAAEIFSKLKKLDFNAELITEFAKQLTWHERMKCLEDQFYVAGKQYHKMHMLKDKVEVAVTDSPLILSLYYNQLYAGLPECFDQTILHLHKSFEDQINVLLKRSKNYNPKGRNQTEEEAKLIDVEIEALLIKHGIPFIVLDTDTAADKIVKLVLDEHIAKKNKELIASWPEWKQNALGDIRSQPAVKPEGLNFIPAVNTEGARNFQAIGDNDATYSIVEQYKDHYRCFVDTFCLPTEGTLEECRYACEEHANGRY